MVKRGKEISPGGIDVHAELRMLGADCDNSRYHVVDARVAMPLEPTRSFRAGTVTFG
jgi:hypothetical protein